MSTEKSFLLIDDHSIVRSALRLIIKNKYSSALIEDAFDGSGALELLARRSYDLLIIDLVLPHTDTLELLETILSLYPESKILVFTMVPGNVVAYKYYQLGIKGFLNKECEETEVGQAIDVILEKKKYVSDKLIPKLMEYSISGKSDNPFNDLSVREKEIVRLLISGKSVGEITFILKIKNSTVGTYKARIFEKTRVVNVVDLHQLAVLYRFI